MSALSDLYSLIPEAEGFILGRDLCAVFATYEARRGTQLLQPAEREALQLFARENADARVDGEVLVALIGQLLMTTGQEDERSGQDGPSTPVSRGVRADNIRGAESAAATGQATTTPHNHASPAAVDTPASSTPISHIPRRKPLASTTPAPTTTPGDGKPTTTLPPPSSYRTDHRGRRGSDGASPLVDGVSGKSPTPHAHTPTRSASALSSYPAASSTTPTTTMSGTTGGITRPRPPRSGRTSTGASTTGTPPATAAAGKGGNSITSGRRTSVTSPPAHSAPGGAAVGGRLSSVLATTTTTAAGMSSPSPSAKGTTPAETGKTTQTNQLPAQPASPDLPALMMGVDSEVSMLDETSFVGFSHHRHHQQALHAAGSSGGLEMEMDDVLDSGRGHGHGSRLDRISTTSSTSLTASHDAFEALKRENADLARRKAELVRQVQVIGTETEAQMADLQEALDGARAELAIKKKEEKDSRTREAQLGTQICTLELEMQHLQQQLSTARESYSMQQRMLQDSNAESARLRDVVLSKEADVAGLKLAIEAYEDEKRSWQDQVETLQATNATLQAGLQAAQQAARTLERRKAENQELQQTIKRLTHELDLIRTRQTAAAVAGSGHERAATDASEAGAKDLEPGSSVGTGGKSLSDELRSRFVQRGASDSDDSDDDRMRKGKTVIRTVTYRTERVVRHREPRARQDGQETSDESEPEDVSVVEEEIMREYTDAGVETDPLPVAPAAPSEMAMASTSIQTDETHHGALPPYSPRSDTMTTAVEDALAHTHPAIEDVFGGVVGLEQHRAVAAAYADMSVKLGSRCTVFEEKLKLKQEEAMKCSEQGSWSLATSSTGTQLSTTLDPRPGLSKSLGYLSAAVVVAGMVGHYLGWWRGYSSENELILHDYKLLYGHLPIRQFLPNTTGVKVLAGGVKQFTGRTPI